jgi:3-hydroxyacyl-CoA dehydrogenase / enoyl-CoA hydratase / 3-hydroxybutyryl-CoA epimerase
MTQASYGAWSFTEKEGIGNLLFDNPGSDVNVLTSEHIRSFDAAVSELAKKELKALTITSAKSRIFIAGADIREIEGIRTPEDAIAKAELGKAILRKLEDLPYPTVCVINGACLGGGYELALACKWRVASFSPSVRIGLPEVNLGILPGFGGSIRLPRLVGLLKGLPLILTGKMCSAEEALKNGMVDKLFPEPTLWVDAFEFAKKVSGGATRPKRKKTWQTWLLEDTPMRAMVFSRAKKDVLEKTKGHYPAPVWIIRLLAKTYGRRSKGIWRMESEFFAKLGATEISKNLIATFFLTEKYKKVKWTKADVKTDGVKKCGVVGAGVMGGGIAQLVSLRDIPVRIKDLNEKALAGALKEAMSIYQKAASRRKIRKHEVENKMDLISAGMTNDGLSNCDIIIEAVVEDLGIKLEPYGAVDRPCFQYILAARDEDGGGL